MAGPHTERLTALLTEEATAALHELRDVELEAGGFIHDHLVTSVTGFMEPRLPKYMERLVGRVAARVSTLTGADLLNWIDGVLSESRQ